MTLTGYNAEYSDRPFLVKRDIDGGFGESPLRVNKGLGEIDTWNENTIHERANALSNTAIGVWKSPKLKDDSLDAYILSERKLQASRIYSLADHPYLSDGYTTRNLFDSIRKEILSLDPCVSEEILKLYIAFKAETNFVDIIPLAKRLRVVLNMQFHELHDSRKIARDITGLGRWGNGNVEISLTKSEDIPYVLSLARQALETQLGDEGTEN